MTMTLTQARARTARYLDDVDNEDASTQDLDDALGVAFPAVFRLAAKLAPSRFAIEGSVSSAAAGTVDLTSLTPDVDRIVTVNYVSGATRMPVPEAALSDGPTDCAGVKTLKIVYLPVLTFPAAAGNNFVWGQSALDFPVLDDLMCLRAAASLSVVMDQGNKQLEKEIAQRTKDVEELFGISGGWKNKRGGSRSLTSGLSYVKTDATTLQLVTMWI